MVKPIKILTKRTIISKKRATISQVGPNTNKKKPKMMKRSTITKKRAKLLQTEALHDHYRMVAPQHRKTSQASKLIKNTSSKIKKSELLHLESQIQSKRIKDQKIGIKIALPTSQFTHKRSRTHNKKISKISSSNSSSSLKRTTIKKLKKTLNSSKFRAASHRLITGPREQMRLAPNLRIQLHSRMNRPTRMLNRGKVQVSSSRYSTKAYPNCHNKIYSSSCSNKIYSFRIRCLPIFCHS